MIRCLDIHTHHPAPQPLGVVSAGVTDFTPMEGQFYSLGIHPWETGEDIPEETWNSFRNLASHPLVVAIGECGIDLIKGGPLFRQLLVMKRQIDISEKLKKPLVIHDVKAHDIILGLKRDLKPVQNWLVHGFRGKPQLAEMLTKAGIFLSFGEKFNPDTVKTLPREFLLAETDESPLPIGEIISSLSECRGEDLTVTVSENTNRFLGLKDFDI